MISAPLLIVLVQALADLDTVQPGVIGVLVTVVGSIVSVGVTVYYGERQR